MFDRFTARARHALVLTQDEARLLDHSYIGPEHLLLGLIHEREGVAGKVLESLDISLPMARTEVAAVMGKFGSASSGSDVLPFSPRAKNALLLALKESLGFGHDYVCTEHLLLGVVGEVDTHQVLAKLGLESSHVRKLVAGSKPASRLRETLTGLLKAKVAYR